VLYKYGWYIAGHDETVPTLRGSKFSMFSISQTKETPMRNISKILSQEEIDERMKAAQARAVWELGDASWAGVIVGAFLYPEEDLTSLEEEKKS
jgi:hypothetical protein